ncbi:RNA polymerase sigma factor [Humisphaera borealis]|uniref:Sigma-70 family RNA polymerase sigma factor n=1 Tax=Humisphaera borealis TaxID=2807512 RepID=A0A7M2WQ61_9BACT|nr:hypothetical protein [Humisphaera borealis]QOV87586.1 hypothetical protein IPV69_14950 [Humisphaera borealis]
MATRERDEPAAFPKTSWSLVGRAAGAEDKQSRDALNELVIRYLPALRAHLILARRLSHDTADELLQEFLASKLIENTLVARAQPERGKFRTFLLASLRNFLVDRARAARAKKRGGGEATLAIDADVTGDPADPRAEEPSAAFEAAWARQVMDRAATLMHQTCDADGRTDLWTVFEARLLAPSRDGTPPADYEVIARTIGGKSAEQVSNLLTTAKRQFNRSLREAIAEYAGDGEVDQEIHDLHDALAKAKPQG